MKMKIEEQKLAICQLCDNYTTQIWVEQAKDFGCENCYNAYGVEGMEF